MTAIVVTAVVTFALTAGVAGGVWWWLRGGIRQQVTQYQAFLEGWRIQQSQFETEQRLREAARAAMGDMIAETRRHTGGAGSFGSDLYGPNPRE